jgi:hypothetical protein
LRVVIFWLLSAALLFGAAVTDINYSDKHDKKGGVFNLTLSFDSSFNNSFEQKYEGGILTIVFDGLIVDKPFMKTFNTSLIQSVSVNRSDKNSTKILFVGKQLVDVSISNSSDKLYIALTPRSVPLTMEDIAKDTGSGEIIGHVLDILFYVVIGLLFLTIAVILFLKIKLFPMKKTAAAPKTEEKLEYSTLNSSETDDTSEAKIEKPALSAKKQPKAKPQKKKAQQKTLFD